MSTKRKRDGSDPESHKNFLCGAEDTATVEPSNIDDGAAQSPAEVVRTVAADALAPAALRACRSALVKGPAASRAALDKYGDSIDTSLAKVLQGVGGYEMTNGNTTLHESVRRGDVATTLYLLVAGADVNARNWCVKTPHTIGTDEACCDLLVHHAGEYLKCDLKPAALASAACAYCVALTSPLKEPMPKSVLSLREHHLDPSFLWAPAAARARTFTWARDACIAQVAAITQPFAKLPDDCAGDVLEFLELVMSRNEMLIVAEHCSSVESRAWVHDIVVAAVAASATPRLVPAAQEGDLIVVKNCLKYGADVGLQTSEHGFTALIQASVEGHMAVVSVLLEAGADMEIRDEHCSTALIYAAHYGHTPIVELLLEAGADKEAKNDRGYTALISSSEEGHTDVVELILEAGADTEAENEDRNTALMFASEKGHTDIVKILLEAGANKNTKDKSDISALMVASDSSHTEIVTLLLQAGADIEAKTDSGTNALLYASMDGYVCTAELLLEAGAEIEVKGENGMTALMEAAYYGNPGMVELLLEAGANRHPKNNAGKTAQDLAQENDHPEVVALLEE